MDLPNFQWNSFHLLISVIVRKFLERWHKEPKAVMRAVLVPKTKKVEEAALHQTTSTYAERTDFISNCPKPPLPNQQDDSH